MDGAKRKDFDDEADSSIDTSVVDTSDFNQDNSVNYQTADEENSRYFSVIENDSTLEEICETDVSLRDESEQNTMTDSRIGDGSSDSVQFETDAKSEVVLDGLSLACVEAVDKFHVHEKIDAGGILSGGIDIFDDNESSVDGHELIIDDDPQPSEKSDDCRESGTEASTDMRYEDEAEEASQDNVEKSADFSISKKAHLQNDCVEISENTTTSQETDDTESCRSRANCRVDFKDLIEDSEEGEVKSDKYNFPEGSHRVNLVIDGNNVEAINIGQDIYIYTDTNGELTAFQVVKVDGNLNIKYLHVGKNDDGNIEVYEEQVNHVSVSNDDSDSVKEKDISKINKSDKATLSEDSNELQKSSSDIEKNSQSLLMAVMNQEKKTIIEHDSLSQDSDNKSLICNFENFIKAHEERNEVKFNDGITKLEIDEKIEIDDDEKLQIDEDEKLEIDEDSDLKDGEFQESVTILAVEDIGDVYKINHETVKMASSEIVNFSETEKEKIDKENTVTMYAEKPLKFIKRLEKKESSFSYVNDREEKLSYKTEIHSNLVNPSVVLLSTASHVNNLQLSEKNSIPHLPNEIKTIDAGVLDAVNSDALENIKEVILTTEEQCSTTSDPIKSLLNDGVESSACILISENGSSNAEPKIILLTAEENENVIVEVNDANENIFLPVKLNITKKPIESVAINAKIEDSNVKLPNLKPEKCSNKGKDVEMSVLSKANVKSCDLSSSVDSDDDFEDEYVEGEPVTGDSEINWNDVKNIDKGAFTEKMTLGLEINENQAQSDDNNCDISVCVVTIKPSENVVITNESDILADKHLEQKTHLGNSLSQNSPKNDQILILHNPIAGENNQNILVVKGDAISNDVKLRSENAAIDELLKENSVEMPGESVSVENDNGKFDSIEIEKIYDASNDEIVNKNTIVETLNTNDQKIVLVPSPNVIHIDASNLDGVINSNIVHTLINNQEQEILLVPTSDVIQIGTTINTVVHSEASSLPNKNNILSLDNNIIINEIKTIDTPKEMESNLTTRDSYNILTEHCRNEILAEYFNPVVKTSNCPLKTYSKESKLHCLAQKKSTCSTLLLSDSNNMGNNTNPPVLIGIYNESHSVVDRDAQLESKSLKIDVQNDKIVDLSPLKTKDVVCVDESISCEQSPKNKSRQPRKQVFSTVASSDIEMIFSNVDTAKNDHSVSTAKSSKNSGKSRSKMNDSNCTPSKSLNDSPKHNKNSSKKLNEQESSKVSIDNEQENKSNTLKDETAINLSEENDIKHSDVENKSPEDAVKSLQSPDIENKSPVKDISKESPSNSAKRKRGRPKKIISSGSKMCECVILNADGSPSTLADNKPNLLMKTSSSIAISEEANSLIDSEKEKSASEEISDVKDKNVNPSPDTGKRKKGRPKKICIEESSQNNEQSSSSPERSIESDLKEQVKMEDNANDSSVLSTDETMGDNICPICSKNFRSKNVLLKHAKHCNGIINVEHLKSPKKRKAETSFEHDISDEKKLKSDLESCNSNISLVSGNIEECDVSKCSTDLNDEHDKTGDTSSLHVIDKKCASIDGENAIDLSLPHKNDVSTVTIDDSICEIVQEPQTLFTAKTSCTVNDKISEDDRSVAEESKELRQSNIIQDNKDKIKILSEKVKNMPTRSLKLRELKKTISASPMSRLSKILNTKPLVNKVIKCEICGKTFRQLAHMVYHRNKHESEKVIPVESSVEKPVECVEPKPKETPQQNNPETILKCDVCKKGFRKLHHLVEHREVHANTEIKSRRTSVASVRSEHEAGFRCDTCDKSFRKLHHLVEHRELHMSELNDSSIKPVIETKAIVKPTLPIEDATCNGCGKSFRKRHHMVEHRDIHCSPNKIKNTSDTASSAENNVRLSFTSSTSDDSNNCEICGKSYRKLHHMVEHRESHTDPALKQEDRSSRIPLPDALSSRDIIHECPRCYMVFPNTNSLNKHTVHCFNKKVLRKSTVVGENSDNKQIVSTNRSFLKRKSIDSTKSEPVSKSLATKGSSAISQEKLNRVSKKLNVIKVPTTKTNVKIPQAVDVKKLDTKASVDESKVKYRINSDYHFKYKINPSFKANTSLNQTSSSARNSPKSLPSVKTRKSESSLKASNVKTLQTIAEESSFRYSFPKTPKNKDKGSAEEKSAVPVKNEKVKQSTPITSHRKSLIPNKVKTSNNNNEPKLVITRRSLGGRNSIDRKLPMVRSKLKLKCCNKVFDSQASLAAHRKTHKVHKCDCGKSFGNEVLLKRHMDMEHTPPKSFKCQSCGVSVRTAAQYAKHKKTHEAEAVASTAQSALTRKTPRKVANATDKSGVAASATPSHNPRKRRIPHGGVPLTEKMRKAIAGAKF